tara:strand:+ start:1007 stop:1186 length:180 start_codon:yes stop_codon:yes gene_type:complete
MAEIVIVKGLYANKSVISQAKRNPKTLIEVQELTETNQDFYEIPPGTTTQSFIGRSAIG